MWPECSVIRDWGKGVAAFQCTLKDCLQNESWDSLGNRHCYSYQNYISLYTAQTKQEVVNMWKYKK